MADKIVEKGTSRKSHMAKARGIDERADKLQKKLRPGQLLDKDTKNRLKDGKFNVGGLNYGHFVKSDPRDVDQEIKRQLVQEGGEKGIGPWGVITSGQDDIDYLKDKKAQEEQVNSLKFAALLVDPDHPATQVEVYKKFPELKTYPDEFYHQQLAVQEALRNMIRDGTINGQEDLDLIRYILRPDTVIPLFPAWDPTGTIVNQALGTIGEEEWLSKSYARGFLSPRQWSTGDEQTGYQKELKRILFKRLFPQARSWKDSEVQTFLSAPKKNGMDQTVNDEPMSLYRTALEFFQSKGSKKTSTSTDIA